MATEIERKFLVEADGWRQHADRGTAYRQGYLSTADNCSVRVRLGGGQAWLNIKSAEVGASRSEYEYPIPLADAEAILDRLCQVPPVEKTRYVVRYGDHNWEVDVFDGANAGLVVAEIELERVDQSFELPDWIGTEVTDDWRYYNSSLAVRPFRSW